MEKYQKAGASAINEKIVSIKKIIIDSETVQAQLKKRYKDLEKTIYNLEQKIRELKKSRDIVLKGEKDDRKV